MNRSSASGPPARGAGARRTARAPRASARSRLLSAPSRPNRRGRAPRRGERWRRRRPCDDCPLQMADRSLAKRLLEGDRRALARAITLVEDDRPEGWELVKEIYPHTGAAEVVGFTGPPGVGKSTLIGALTKARRAAGRTVGVLSIDPSSPFTQ